MATFDEEPQFMAQSPLPQSMNFRNMLDSASAGVREKLYIQPTNGSEFTSGSTFSEFHIPGNRSNTFADLTNAYIELDITTSVATISLDVAGVLNAIERIEGDTTSGVRIFETRSKDVIDNLTLMESNIVSALDGPCAVMMGTKSNTDNNGVDLSGATTKKFIIPIINTPINHYWPMIGNDGLRFRIHWASGVNLAIETAGSTLASNSFSYTNVKLHYDTILLNSESMASLNKETNGRYVITGNAYQNQQEIASSQSLISNLGFGRTKCKRIYVALRNTSAIANVLQSSHSFDCHTLRTAELRYNGRLINESSLNFEAGNQAVVMAEILKQMGKSLISSTGISTVANFETAIPSPTSALRTGTFHIVFDLTGGADTYLSESGLDTRTGSFQLSLSSGTNLAHTVDIFCEYETQIVLDMNADKVFRVMS